MSKRRKLTKKASKKSFRKHSGTHIKNVKGKVMRGGIRL